MTDSRDVTSAGGRVLGLDVGERWVGLAVSDPERRFALPLRTLDRRAGDVTAEIREVVRQDEVTLLVAGLPVSLSGEIGAQAEQTQAFARELAASLGLPVEFWDERLSSFQAQRSAPAASRGKKDRRGGKPQAPQRDDATAAAVVLQAYLDRQRFEAR
jgi:putative Holliday junction resolvase